MILASGLAEIGKLLVATGHILNGGIICNGYYLLWLENGLNISPAST
jgi:hypothetical protein